MEKNIKHIVASNLCMSCGVCETACPFDALHINTENLVPIPQIDEKKCKYCGRCLKSCPGKGLDLNAFKFDSAEDIKSDIAGKVINSFIGYSKDNNLRFKASSGGLVTAFLIYLLRKHIIDGAIVTTFLPQDKKSKAFLATTPNEIIEAKGSKYIITSLNNALSELHKANKGHYIVVALPCQTQGIRQLMKIDKDLREKIIGIFGLYCSVNKTRNAIDYYYRRWKIEPDLFSFRTEGYLGYMKMKNSCKTIKVRYEDYWHGTHSFFVNERCALCKDHFAELADVSFGDINIPPYNNDKIGINSIVVRSRYWLKLLKEANLDGLIYLRKVPLLDIVKSQKYATLYKKGVGLQATLRIYMALGKKIPDYSYKNIHVPFKDIVKQAISMIMRYLGKNERWFFLISKLDHSKNVNS